MRKVISVVALVVALSCSVYAGEMQYGITSNTESDTITQIMIFLSVLPL
jgi:hypothetical protein